MTDKNRNFATHPRTLREALTIILDHSRRNRICEGQFQYENRNDPIFSCFTIRQRNDILKKMDAGEETIKMIVSIIGEKNLKAMTGMTPAQADAMIYYADCYAINSPKVFRDYLAAILKNGAGVIGGKSFKLDAA